MKIYWQDIAAALLLGFAALALASTSGCAADTHSDSDQHEAIEDFCDAVETCVGQDADQCRLEVEDQARDAENTGCSASFNAIVDCLNISHCDGQVLIVDCESEMGAYAHCVGKATPS